MNPQRWQLLVPVTIAIALTSGCGSDGTPFTDSASGAAAGGHAGTGTHAAAGSGGRTAASGATGRAGDEGSAAGDTLVPVEGGAGGDAAAGGDSGASGAAGSADSGGDSGGPGDPSITLQRFAYVATFLNGLSLVSIDPATGKLSPLSATPVNPGGQLYAVSVDPAQRFVYTADRTAKKINTYAIAADGTLPAQPNSTLAIDGSPTSLTLDVQGRFAYVASADEDKAVSTFKIDSTSGALTAVGEPVSLVDSGPAYVAADPSGHFVYVSQNSVFGIRGYRVDQTTGALSELPSSPFALAQVFAGAIAFDPAGRFLFSAGNGLNAYAIDAASGALTRVEGSPFSTQVSSDPSATNLVVEPRGKYLYATSFLNPPRVFGFVIDSQSGKLTAVPGEPIKGGSPYSLGVEPSARFVLACHDDGTTAVFSLRRADGTLHEIEGSPFSIGGLQPEIAFATAH